MSYLLGRKVEYTTFEPDPEKPLEVRTGRIVHVVANQFLIEEEHSGHLDWATPSQDSRIRFVEPVHPAGLRPVAFTCAEFYEGEQQGWLVNGRQSRGNG